MARAQSATVSGKQRAFAHAIARVYSGWSCGTGCSAARRSDARRDRIDALEALNRAEAQQERALGRRSGPS